ncbi:MAG: glycosyltransferase, partial [Oceanospirillales bacterium]
ISDVVLSLSKKPESFGRTVLEALSIGTPVVGYDHGGVGEILGELFPEGRVLLNTQGLDKKVIELISENKQPDEVDQFSLSMMLDKTYQLYQRVGLPNG